MLDSWSSAFVLCAYFLYNLQAKDINGDDSDCENIRKYLQLVMTKQYHNMIFKVFCVL